MKSQVYHLHFRMILWAIVLPWTFVAAFNPFQRKPQHDSTISKTEIDISDVLAETEAALHFAQDALPSSDSIDDERQELSTLALQQQQQDQERQSFPMDDMIVTAIASVVGEVGSSLAQQVDQATKFAKKQLEENDNDITKLTGTILSEVGTKVEEDLLDMSQFAEDFKTGRAFQEFVTFLKSDEVQQASSDLLQQTEQTSVKTWQLVKAGLESDEVKAAQQKTLQAIQHGMESDEFKDFQNKTSAAIQEQLQSLKKL